MTLAERLQEPDVAGLPEWRVADILNARDIANGEQWIDVPTHDVRGVLLTTGEWAKLRILAERTAVTEENAQIIGIAITAYETLTRTETIQTSQQDRRTAVEQMLAALVAAQVVSQATADALLAMRKRPMSWAEANNIHVDARAVSLARGAVA